MGGELKVVAQGDGESGVSLWFLGDRWASLAMYLRLGAIFDNLVGRLEALRGPLQSSSHLCAITAPSPSHLEAISAQCHQGVWGGTECLEKVHELG